MIYHYTFLLKIQKKTIKSHIKIHEFFLKIYFSKIQIYQSLFWMKNEFYVTNLQTSF